MPDCGCNHFPAAGGNVTFDPGVNVGIGTTSPATILNVSSTGSYPTFLFQGSDPASGVNGLSMYADAHAYTLFVGGSQNPGMPNAFGLYDATVGAFRLVVNPSGNVGIGAQSPGAKLTVSGLGSSQIESGSATTAADLFGATADRARLTVGNTNAGTGSGQTSRSSEILFYGYNVAGTALQAKFELATDAEQNGTQSFFIYDTVARAFRVYLGATGNVGIGTNSPTARLQVAGVASTVTLLVQPLDNTDAVRVTPNADGQTSAAFGVTNAAGSAVTGAILKNGAGQFSASLQLTRTDTGATYTKLLVDSNDLHLTSSATSNGLPTGTRGTIALQTNPFGDAIVQLGSAPNTGALLVYQAGAQVLGLGRNQFNINTNDTNGVNYQYLTLDGGGLHLAATNPGAHNATITLNTNTFGDALLNVGTGPGTGALIVQQAGQQVLGVGRAQFGVYTVDANGVDYVYLNLDGNGLHLAATNPGFHGSVISLNTNTFGDAILSVGTGPGVGDLIVMQSGAQLMSIGGGGNLALAGRTVANGNGCLYA